MTTSSLADIIFPEPTLGGSARAQRLAERWLRASFCHASNFAQRQQTLTMAESLQALISSRDSLSVAVPACHQHWATTLSQHALVCVQQAILSTQA